MVKRSGSMAWGAMACIVALGFVLRALAANGDLWTDEAWSLIMAGEAGGPLGVITNINHDNNHHLNSWWLQLVGPDAPVWLMRGLSVVSGTATIAFAGMIGWRQSKAAGLVAALLFAVAPIMVVFGSEARGYAPMLLALVVLIWCVDRWLSDPSRAFPTRLATIAALIGTFGHLLMLPSVMLVALWVMAARIGVRGVQRAIEESVRRMTVPVATSLFVAAMIAVIGFNSPGGFKVGGVTPFAWDSYRGALNELIYLTTGLSPSGVGELILAAIAVLILALRAEIMPHRKWLAAVMLITLPLLVALIHPGNSQFARYYLPVAVGLMLLLGDVIGAAFKARGGYAIVAGLLLGVMTTACLIYDRSFIASGRGRGGAPVRIMMAQAPRGTTVAIDQQRTRAILSVAADPLRYPLTIHTNTCGDERYRLVERFAPDPANAPIIRCGVRLDPIARADAVPPSGQGWTLYARHGAAR